MFFFKYCKCKWRWFFSEGRSCHPSLAEGGAFQVSLSQLQVDCYPYHLASAAGDRSSWIRYTPGSVHPVWLENSLRSFKTSLIEAANTTLSLNASTSKAHTPLYRAVSSTSFISKPLSCYIFYASVPIPWEYAKAIYVKPKCTSLCYWRATFHCQDFHRLPK